MKTQGLSLKPMSPGLFPNFCGQPDAILNPEVKQGDIVSYHIDMARPCSLGLSNLVEKTPV